MRRKAAEPRDHTMHVRISRSDLRMLRTMASARNVDVADIIRDAFRKEFTAHLRGGAQGLGAYVE